ncbi:hypothetical protein EVAR_87863_1 [Eumeta japonica]|uniref:Uncharacterized protein n=1 Tax=Eumeta variegata TaxID=151549 RepID=A0A4C1WU03_EUMVA|nr:hypothetical protein EVAR_87863_1 [Eumeta japonica]
MISDRDDLSPSENEYNSSTRQPHRRSRHQLDSARDTDTGGRSCKLKTAHHYRRDVQTTSGCEWLPPRDLARLNFDVITRYPLNRLSLQNCPQTHGRPAVAVAAL